MGNLTLNNYLISEASFKSQIKEKRFNSKKEIYSEVKTFWTNWFAIFKRSVKDSSLVKLLGTIETMPLDIKSLIDYKIKFHFSVRDLLSIGKNSFYPFLTFHEVNVDALCAIMEKIATDIDSIPEPVTTLPQPQFQPQQQTLAEQNSDTDKFAKSFQQILADVYSLEGKTTISEDNINLLISDINDALNDNGYESENILTEENSEYFTIIKTSVSRPVLKLPAIVSSISKSVVARGRIMVPNND